MKFLTTLCLTLLSLNSLATTFEFADYSDEHRLCLAKKECMEYNGQIIDLRSDASRMYAKAFRCDYRQGQCANNEQLFSRLTPSGATQILGHSKDKSYFIPLSIKESDALLLLGSLSLGTIVFANDRQIMDFVQKNKSEKTSAISSVANLFGREAIIPIVAGAYFMGAIMDNGKLKQVGLFAISTGLATQLVTEVFKKTFERKRPISSDSPYDFFTGENDNSFFSGHTSAAFSLATVIAETYKDNPVVPFLAYGTATLTAYARMHDRKHWATDVLAGAVAGHLITKIMMRTWENRNSNSGGFIVTPMMGVDFGINITYVPGRKKSQELRCSRSNSQGAELIRECLSEAFERSR